MLLSCKMYALRVIVRAFCVTVNGFFRNMNKKSAAAVLDRLQLVFGVRSDSALATAMDIGRSTLGGWRTRGTVPYAECVNLAEAQGISLDWLLLGEGEMRRGAMAGHVDADWGALLAALSEDDRRELLLIARSKKRLRDVERALAAFSPDFSAP